VNLIDFLVEIFECEEVAVVPLKIEHIALGATCNIFKETNLGHSWDGRLFSGLCEFSLSSGKRIDNYREGAAAFGIEIIVVLLLLQLIQKVCHYCCGLGTINLQVHMNGLVANEF